MAHSEGGASETVFGASVGWRTASALGGAAAAAIGVTAGLGFTVDDALISTRVAHHIARGYGYRLNPSGPSIDSVTPLGWAHFLAPFAARGPWAALLWASTLGALTWIGAAALLGRRCAEVTSGWRLGMLGIALASCLPLGAWASAGMETPFVMALAVAALAPGLFGAAAAGLAGALRPELVPWAATLAFGSALARRDSMQRRAAALAAAVLPALGVAAVRWAAFGLAVPLAVFAKRSDAVSGLRYAAGALLLSGPAYLLLATAPTLRALPRQTWAIGAASAVHIFVLVGVGGDWMPFWRLALPIFPGFFLIGAHVAQRSGLWACSARCGAALACAALLEWGLGSAARQVRPQRERVMGEAAPLLAGARRVASVDIGWVGASGAHELVDLAGVTDPEVAFLPGGHTSKRLPADFLERRGVDALVLLAQRGTSPSEPARFKRAVEQRVMTLRGAGAFQLRGRVPLDTTSEYWILRMPEAESAR